MRMKKNEDFIVAVISVCFLLLLAAFTIGPCCAAKAQVRGDVVAEAIALPQASRVMEAKQPYEGGIKSKDVRPGEGVVIIFYNSGLVETNALKFANTPVAELPVIESALRKQMIVDAALAQVEGASVEEKLSVAADNAGAVLRTLAARETAVELNPVSPPSGEGGVVENKIEMELIKK